MKQFNEFPKMPRLSRPIIITEKIDGTNASIDITLKENEEKVDDTHGNMVFIPDPHIIAVVEHEGHTYTFRAGSRNKWIMPGKSTDNQGFASWVVLNANELVKLGEGHHFGEWWGKGIQRGYGLQEKRFSLFNVVRWADEALRPKCCHVVPVLWEGEFRTPAIDMTLEALRDGGSVAAPGFMKPEGIIVWHTAGNFGLKKTIEKDESPKSLANG